MNKDNEKTDFGAILLLIVVVVLFFFVHWIAAIVGFIIGVIILGWGKRHEGPFPTNKSEDDR